MTRTPWRATLSRRRPARRRHLLPDGATTGIAENEGNEAPTELASSEGVRTRALSPPSPFYSVEQLLPKEMATDDSDHRVVVASTHQTTLATAAALPPL